MYETLHRIGGYLSMAPSRPPIVLIADDDILVLVSTRDALIDAGLTVVEAPDADAALSILTERPDIGILFTDINMPGERDGVALSHAARTLNADIAIIVTSGLERPTTSELPSDCVFLEKPYSTARLIGIVADLAGSAPQPPPM
jgi:DNA-binding NtrC family response regulator